MDREEMRVEPKAVCPGRRYPAFRFMADFVRGCVSMTELCTLYRGSRKIGYEWVERNGVGRSFRQVHHVDGLTIL